MEYQGFNVTLCGTLIYGKDGHSPLSKPSYTYREFGTNNVKIMAIIKTKLTGDFDERKKLLLSVGFVVSKNTIIYELKRAIQGDKLCMIINIRIHPKSNNFRIVFFTKDVKKIHEELFTVGRLENELEPENVVKFIYDEAMKENVKITEENWPVINDIIIRIVLGLDKKNYLQPIIDYINMDMSPDFKSKIEKIINNLKIKLPWLTYESDLLLPD